MTSTRGTSWRSLLLTNLPFMICGAAASFVFILTTSFTLRPHYSLDNASRPSSMRGQASSPRITAPMTFLAPAACPSLPSSVGMDPSSPHDVILVTTTTSRDLNAGAIVADALETGGVTGVVHLAIGDVGVAANERGVQPHIVLISHELMDVLRLVECVVNGVKPVAILAPQGGLLGTAAAHAAATHGLLLMSMHDGVQVGGGQPFQAQLELVPTQGVANDIIARGGCPSQVQVVGSPYVDAMLDVLRVGPSSVATELLKSLSLPTPDATTLIRETEGMVALPSTALTQAAQRTLVVEFTHVNVVMKGAAFAVRRLATHFPNLRFVVVPHTVDTATLASDVLRGLSAVSILDAMVPTYDIMVMLLAATDGCMVTEHATVREEEAAALGRVSFTLGSALTRPEALASGLAFMAGADVDSMVASIGAWARARVAEPHNDWPPQGATLQLYPDTPPRLRPATRIVYGDGHAVGRIVKHVRALLLALQESPQRLPSGCAVSASTTVPALLPHAYHDTTWHDGVGVLQAPHTRWWHTLECSAQEKFMRSQQRKLAEILAMPSTYAPKAAGFELTIIVSVFRRPQFFERLLQAFAAQTHAPTAVWVTTFNSAHEQEFRNMTNTMDPEHKMFKFIAGDVNFKYFGRFALGMMAKTPYVAFFDDDCIPGKHALANAMHMMHVTTGEYMGLIGMKGHGNTAEDPVTHVQLPYHGHWEYRSEFSVLVDLTGGMWFLRTDWVRQMFREVPIEILGDVWGTGEDFQLTYGLRQFLNLPTHLLAVDPQDENTWPHSADYFGLSGAGDSTGGNVLDERMHILFQLFTKGYTPARTQDVWGEAHGRTNVLVVLPTVAHARAIAPVHAALKGMFSTTMRLLLVVAADPRPVSGAVESRDAILRELGMTWDIRERIVGVWDLDLPKLGKNAAWTDASVSAEVQVALGGVLRTIRPALVIAPFSQSNTVAVAAAAMVSLMRVPLIGYDHPAACNVKRVVFGADRSASLDLCLPDAAHARALGPYNLVSNSQLLVLKQVVDTLCACPRTTSADVGAYSICPDDNVAVRITEFAAAG